MRTLAVLLVFVLAALPARAQSLLTADPLFNDDQRDCIVMTLELDGAQTDLLDELLLAYHASAADAVAELEALRDEEDLGEGDFERVLDTLQELSQRTAALRDTLYRDLALVLREDQRPRLSRCRSRIGRLALDLDDFESFMEPGAAMGEDPVRIALGFGLPDGLDPEARERFTRAMRAYDDALEGRVRDLDEALVEMLEGVSELTKDPMAGMARFEEVMGGASDAVNAYRREHRDRGLAIARALPDPLAGRWMRAFMHALYPGPYATTACETVIERLLDAPQLTAQDLERILHISDEHDRSAGSIRKDWCDELDGRMRKAEFSLLAMAMREEVDVAEPFRSRLDALGERYLSSLRNAVGRQRVDAVLETLAAEEREAREEGAARADEEDDADGEQSGGVTIRINPGG